MPPQWSVRAPDDDDRSRAGLACRRAPARIHPSDRRQVTVYYLGMFIFGVLAIVLVVAFMKQRSERGRFDD